MDRTKGNSAVAAGSGLEQEQRCRQQMQRAGELCKRLLRRLDVAGASLRRALDGCRLGLERLQHDKRNEAERLLREVPRQTPAPAPPQAQPKLREPPPAPPPAPAKQRTLLQVRQVKPPKRAHTLPHLRQATQQKQQSPPLPPKAASKTSARASRELPSRKSEKAKTSAPLLDQKAAPRTQPNKPTWKKLVPKPCKKA